MLEVEVGIVEVGDGSDLGDIYKVVSVTSVNAGGSILLTMLCLVSVKLLLNGCGRHGDEFAAARDADEKKALLQEYLCMVL